MQKWVGELKEKTGRSLDEWMALIQKEGPEDERSRREWLRSKHKLGTNSAWWLAERAEGKGGEDSDPEAYLEAAGRYVEEQYSCESGAAPHLRSVAEARQIARRRREGVPVQNDCAVISQSCIRANQADDEYAYRSWLCVDALPRKTAEAFN